MTGYLLSLDAALCTLSAMRLIMFRAKAGNHKPRASALAYVLIVAAGSIPLLLAFGQSIAIVRVVLDGALCMAVFSVRGNVIELFRRSGQAEGRAAAWLGRRSWL